MLCLKRQCHEIFCNFFHESNPFGSLKNNLNWFCWKIRFPDDIYEKHDSGQCDTASSHGSISFENPKKIVWLGAGKHCAELDSKHYHTGPSPTRCSITLRGVRLRALLDSFRFSDISISQLPTVSHCAKSDSAQAVSHCAESGNWNVRKSKIV